MPAPRTAQEMLKIMKEKIEPQTGRSFDAWVTVARDSGITTHKALTSHLKQSHGLDHNQAQWIAWGVTDPGRAEQYDQPDDLVDGLYSGKKAQLRPIYDRLMTIGLAMGKDITSNVCKTSSSLSAGTQFAVIVPRTQSAVDLELALPPETEPDGRIEAFKSSNPKFNHRIRIKDVSEIDDVVTGAMTLAADYIRG